ncbi:phytoene dehydrogenase [Penicillium sp. DV-2018c]|nr:phytoene dehydrogenase [Penicillium sp. DV-2018c]KAJ5577231.1 phytoene dehydrogenase [Penicillium sp. DV-2018c]
MKRPNAIVIGKCFAKLLHVLYTDELLLLIGAGAGGVATAARLALKGFTVTVVEKNGFIGGRCSLIKEDGYRFDQGPSLLLMPELFEQTFLDLNTSLEAEGVKLLKCEPNYRIWFGDHDSVELSTDMVKMKGEIEHHEGKEGFRRFLLFMKESGQHYDLSMAHVLSKDFPSLSSMLRPNFLMSALVLHPFVSIYSRARKYFLSEKMRRAFTFTSMYLGMSPFDAPGTYSLLQYTELAHGIWYPEGGFQVVLEALAGIGKRLGVEYRLNAPVSSIKLSDDSKSAKGVVLASGEVLTADTVVVNADLVYAYNELLPSSSFAESLKKRSASCSSISFFWSFDCIIPELQTHNVFLADDYRESFDSIFKDHGMPREQSFYVNVPSRIDPTAAPPDKDAVVVLIPVGHLVEDGIWAAGSDLIISKAREAVFDTIESRTGVRNLREHLISEKIETPFSWKEKFNLDKGAILGLSHSFFNVLSFRPKSQHAKIRGLYFVGASTHPGTGVPICLAGSKIVSQQICQQQETEKRMGWSWPVYGSWIVASIFLASLVWCLKFSAV